MNRQAEIKELTSKGILPNEHEMEKHPENRVKAVTFLIGSVSAIINEVLPAKKIIDDMVSVAVEQIQTRHAAIAPNAKL